MSQSVAITRAGPNTPAAPVEAVLDPRRWVVLSVVLVGGFMAVLDASIMNVAIPSIRDDLHASFGDIELVVAAYTLVYAMLLITGGRLGDMYGRKLLFLAGVAVFTVASALCGLAASPLQLILARGVQGIGGALMFPQVLALIQQSFDGPERTQALAWFGVVISAGAIVGQIMGGLIISADIGGLSWRPTFLLNVPIGMAVLVIASLVLQGDRQRAQGRLDLLGVALVSLALLALFVPLIEGRDAGWPAWMLGSFGVCALSTLAFLLWERDRARRGAAPLLNVDLFRQRAFAVGLGMSLAFFCGNAGYSFLFALFLQVGRGFSPIQAAITFTPSAVGFFAMSLLAPKVVPLFGRNVLSAGFAIAGFGYLTTAAILSAAGASVTTLQLAPSVLLIGIGQGLAVTPLIGTILSGIDPKDAGAASGVLTTTLQIGAVTGVAVLSIVFFALAGTPGPAAIAGQYASAFSLTLPIAAALSAVAVVLVRMLPTGRAETANALIERVPSWAAGLAYSMYLATGGRLGQQLFDQILGNTIERRTQRTLHAPEPLADFLVYQFERGVDDTAWLNFLEREALTAGEGPIQHETERLPVIQRQVDEVRRRQAENLIPADLDPELVRLMIFALSSYPRLLPQITRMTTGLAPSDPAFQARWADFLRQLGGRLQPADGATANGDTRQGNAVVAAGLEDVLGAHP